MEALYWTAGFMVYFGIGFGVLTFLGVVQKYCPTKKDEEGGSILLFLINWAIWPVDAISVLTLRLLNKIFRRG